MKFLHCPLIHLIKSIVYLLMIAFSLYNVLIDNKVSEVQTDPNQKPEETVSEARVNPNQTLKEALDDTSFESPNMDTVPNLLTGLKVRANPDQKMKETVDTSFESPAIDTIASFLTGLKVSEARANPNPKLEETVNTSSKSPAMDTIQMKFFKGQNNNWNLYYGYSTKYYKSLPQCYVTEKSLLLNEPTKPSVQKGIDWTKKLLEMWC